MCLILKFLDQAGQRLGASQLAEGIACHGSHGEGIVLQHRAQRRVLLPRHCAEGPECLARCLPDLPTRIRERSHCALHVLGGPQAAQGPEGGAARQAELRRGAAAAGAHLRGQRRGVLAVVAKKLGHCPGQRNSLRADGTHCGRRGRPDADVGAAEQLVEPRQGGAASERKAAQGMARSLTDLTVLVRHGIGHGADASLRRLVPEGAQRREGGAARPTIGQELGQRLHQGLRWVQALHLRTDRHQVSERLDGRCPHSRRGIGEQCLDILSMLRICH
mmetsp:Transcript_107617/g.273200  ORF Transcript_107617/g.273200 Transcript_107617/m.273200 type:complete len:276 (-) Transcript_107617:553-1380(-)